MKRVIDIYTPLDRHGSSWAQNTFYYTYPDCEYYKKRIKALEKENKYLKKVLDTGNVIIIDGHICMPQEVTVTVYKDIITGENIAVRHHDKLFAEDLK